MDNIVKLYSYIRCQVTLPEHFTTGRHEDPVHVCDCTSEHTSSSAHPPLSRSHDGSQYVEREV